MNLEKLDFKQVKRHSQEENLNEGSTEIEKQDLKIRQIKPEWRVDRGLAEGLAISTKDKPLGTEAIKEGEEEDSCQVFVKTKRSKELVSNKSET